VLSGRLRPNMILILPILQTDGRSNERLLLLFLLIRRAEN
jgi:hypothetical protein